MSRFERGDIVKVKGFPGYSVIESYLEPDNGPPIVQFWYEKMLTQYVGREIENVNLIRESSFENHFSRGKNKGPK